MESTRITLARVLELGVRVSWREAIAIVHEAVAGTTPTGGAGPARVTTESCLLTRGGDVILADAAAQARPEVVVRLLDDLLASCSSPGRFAGAVADGTALDMIAELSQQITPKRRRVEVASVALRGLAAAADAARAMADAQEEAHKEAPSADIGQVVAAPTPAAPPPAIPPPVVAAPAPPIRRSPAQRARPHVTRRPASFASDLPTATPQVNAVSTPKAVRGSYPSRFDSVKRASPAALAGSVLAVAASVILVLQTPATRRVAVEPSEPALEPATKNAPVVRDDDTPPARQVPARLTEVADLPSMPRLAAPSAPPGSRVVPASFVGSAPLRAVEPETPAENPATIAASGSISPTSAAAAVVPPEAARLSAGAPSPGAVPSPAVASPIAASSLAEAAGPAPANVLPNAVAPAREAEARAIENVLGQYRSAFNALDAGAASAVWPTVNEKTLARAFERLESHDVSFDNCQIEIFSVLAEAACSGSARYVPKVGSRTPRDEARRWRFSLRKASGAWLIDRVDAR